MKRTQIYLTDEEHSGIAMLAQTTGKRQSALIRQAIDDWIGQKKPGCHLSALRQARGIWRHRKDVDLRKIRATFNRI